jgi:hypothetical protein
MTSNTLNEVIVPGIAEKINSQTQSGNQAPFLLSRWFFMRLLGGIYLAAFASLWSQIVGLIGEHGILPVKDFLAEVHRSCGIQGYLMFPTLCWLDPGDWSLHALCATGVVLSCLLILGFCPGPVLFCLWTCYLSLTVAGQVFLTYQWDILLLETGFLAIFYAPWGLWPRLVQEAPPSPALRWLLRWLLFRLMFGSALVKLMSGDPSWHNLTALEFHYETQPLPTWTSWYMHQLPAWFQRFCVLLMFAFELVVPLFLFGSRKWRHLACAGIAAFLLLIALTGNYGFFNLLTMLLCVPQLEDVLVPAFLGNRIHSRICPNARDSGGSTRLLASAAATPPAESRMAKWRRYLLAPIVGGVFLLSLAPFLVNLGTTAPLSWLVKVYEVADSFHSVNNYGLFAVMSTKRSEIVIEGSHDGKTWLAYEFRWKPGDVNRKPGFAAPHLPRLDWQMWFVALNQDRKQPWFEDLLQRLLQGSPEVLALLAENHFRDGPPRLIRALVYDYRFTDRETRSQTGAWWHREYTGRYGPILERNGQP